ncbi:MAG: ferric reductase-like transmembrane domain-containing protein [Acidimicrobiales bacterium]
MNEHVWWYVARATGIVAWALATTSVLWGLALSTRALGSKPKAPWLLDLHRYLGGLCVLFVLAHMGALVADSYVDFGPADLLVPGASSWKPVPVAWGVVAFYLLVAVELTSLAMSRLPKRVWKAVHFSSYVVYLLATVHFLVAGTDATNPVVRVLAIASAGAVAFFTLYRAIGPGRAASARSAKASAKASARDSSKDSSRDSSKDASKDSTNGSAKGSVEGAGDGSANRARAGRDRPRIPAGATAE